MQKKALLILLGIFIALSFADLGSAYYYDDYAREHVIKEKYDAYGYSYIEKNVNSDPWGKVVTYKQIEDYDNPRSRYRNRVYDYWDNGPYYGKYARTSGDYYFGYREDDSWKRNYYDNDNDYYYKPNYVTGPNRAIGYWDHGYYPGW